MLRIFFCLFVISNALFPFVACETGCPPAEDIAPCTCTKDPTPRLICKNIKNLDDLQSVFDSSERYTYEEVRISESAFPSIPVAILEKFSVKKLYLYDSTVQELFDKPVCENKRLSHIELNDVQVLSSFQETNFSCFSMLDELRMENSPVDDIAVNYSNLLPKSLRILAFKRNGIRKIGQGALNLENMEKVLVRHNNLTTISRDIFPTPCYVVNINFDFNKISVIPDGMFHEMPNLLYLNMRHNLITTIPEAAFDSRFRKIKFFGFTENPLRCDCDILWLFKDKPRYLRGRCRQPQEFKGRTMDMLRTYDFSC